MRSRWILPLSFMTLAIAFSTQGTTRGQAGGKITANIRYIDPKDGKEESVDFEVKKESPAGIDILTGGGLKTIPPDQIVQVTYRGLPGLTLDQTTKLGIEEENNPAKAAQSYATAATKASGAAKRFLEFRGAQAALKATNAKNGADFEAEADQTAKLLVTVAKNSVTSWEVWPATRAAARLRMELNQFDEAAKLLSGLAATPGLPSNLRYSARLGEVGALIRAGKVADAKTATEELAKDKDFPRSGEPRQTLAIYQAAVATPEPASADGKPVKPSAAISKIEAAIQAASEPAAKAVGYGILGDIYARHGFPRDAMWSYLWVDVVYPQAKDEQVIAVKRLATVFDGIGEKERAEQYREKLASIR